MYVFEFSTSIANIILSSYLVFTIAFILLTLLYCIKKHIFSPSETVKRNTPSNLFYAAKKQLGCDWK